MTNRFPLEIHSKLKYYIYIYIDPRDNQIFYVGKGKGDRVFAHLSEESEKDKVKRIREIQSEGLQPKIEIVIHGIDNGVDAQRIEASIIDCFGIDNLTNIQRGYHSKEFGRMSIEQIIATYQSEPVNVTHDVVAFKINQTFRYGLSPVELYDITRHSWVMSTREKISYSEEDFIVEFQNPSVHDFLLHYIEKHPDLIEKLLSSSVFLNQFFSIFSNKPVKGKIQLKKKDVQLILAKITNELDSLPFSTLIKTFYSDNHYALTRRGLTLVNKLEYVVFNLDLQVDQKFRNFILGEFSKIRYVDINHNNLDSYLNILKAMHKYLAVNIDGLLYTVLDKLFTVENLKSLYDLKELYPQEFQVFTSNSNNREKMVSIIEDEIADARHNYESFDDISRFNDDASHVVELYGLEMSDELDELQEEVSNREAHEDMKYDLWQDTYKEEAAFDRAAEREVIEEINNLFDSLSN